MKDVSMIFRKALNAIDRYNAKVLSDEIEKLPNVWCRLEDDTDRNWYLISQSDGKTVVEYYGYLSIKFPVALLMDNCPHDIYNIMNKENIFIEKFCESLSCSPEILSRYIDTHKITLIDDRFLFDESFPFDEEAFAKIDEGINYLNPYNFYFDDIK